MIHNKNTDVAVLPPEFSWYNNSNENRQKDFYFFVR